MAGDTRGPTTSAGPSSKPSAPPTRRRGGDRRRRVGRWPIDDHDEFAVQSSRLHQLPDREPLPVDAEDRAPRWGGAGRGAVGGLPRRRRRRRWRWPSGALAVALALALTALGEQQRPDGGPVNRGARGSARTDAVGAGGLRLPPSQPGLRRCRGGRLHPVVPAALPASERRPQISPDRVPRHRRPPRSSPPVSCRPAHTWCRGSGLSQADHDQLRAGENRRPTVVRSEITLVNEHGHTMAHRPGEPFVTVVVVRGAAALSGRRGVGGGFWPGGVLLGGLVPGAAGARGRSPSSLAEFRPLSG